VPHAPGALGAIAAHGALLYMRARRLIFNAAQAAEAHQLGIEAASHARLTNEAFGRFATKPNFTPTPSQSWLGLLQDVALYLARATVTAH